MTPAATFRAAIGAAAVLLVIAIIAAINHYAHFIESNNPHPLFGLKAAAILFLAAVACGIYANYNRPASQR